MTQKLFNLSDKLEPSSIEILRLVAKIANELSIDIIPFGSISLFSQSLHIKLKFT